MTFTFTLSDNQKDLFTSKHKRYDVALENNGKTEHFDFQTSYELKPEDRNDFLYCVLSDAQSYGAYEGLDDLEAIVEFSDEFGYSNAKECVKAFKGCKENWEKLNRLFTEKQLNELWDEVC